MNVPAIGAAKLRLLAGAGVAGAFVLVASYAGVLRHERETLRGQVAQARGEAATWQGQARLNARSRHIGETRDGNIARAVTGAKEAEHEIDTAPDLDGALAAYRLGLDRVRASGASPVTDPGADGGGPAPGA